MARATHGSSGLRPERSVFSVLLLECSSTAQPDRRPRRRRGCHLPAHDEPGVDILERALAERPGRVDAEIASPDEVGRRRLLRLYGEPLGIGAALAGEELEAMVEATQGRTATYLRGGPPCCGSWPPTGSPKGTISRTVEVSQPVMANVDASGDVLGGIEFAAPPEHRRFHRALFERFPAVRDVLDGVRAPPASQSPVSVSGQLTAPFAFADFVQNPWSAHRFGPGQLLMS